jgi:hypothetical protein
MWIKNFRCLLLLQKKVYLCSIINQKKLKTMHLEITFTSKRMQEVVHLCYAFEKMIPMFIEQMETAPTHVFMCLVAKNLESNYLRDLVREFLKKDRPTFNYWVANNYSAEIINSNNYEVFLCSRPGFTEKTLNNIRLHYLENTLENLKRLL